MNPSQLRKHLDDLGMGTADFAEYIGVTQRAVQLWLSGDNPIPPIVARVLELMREKARGSPLA